MRTTRDYDQISEQATPPWREIAATSRWMVLRHLQSERREHVRAWLMAHARHLDAVIRELRGRRAA